MAVTHPRPTQEFFSIGEVCALTDLKPHVLRYWESQFRFLNPAKNRSGNRVYKSREVELIMLVKHLLYTEKYTIEGARQKIEQYRRTGSCAGLPRRAGPGDDPRAASGVTTCSRCWRGAEPARRPDQRGRRLMHILVSNDDGILAGINGGVCRSVGHVTVVALTSRSVDQPFAHASMAASRGAGSIAHRSTARRPTASSLAVNALLPERPAFVFSGVNHGPNMGEDVLYSGTVAVAMEAVTLGIPGVAISFAGHDPEMLATYGPLLQRLVRQVVTVPAFPADTILNVNLPAVPASEVKGTMVTRLGSRFFSESLTRCRTRGAGRCTGSAAARSPGRAGKTRITSRWRRATFR